MKGLKVSLFIGIASLLFNSCVFISPAAIADDLGHGGSGHIATVPYSAVKDENRTAVITFGNHLLNNGAYYDGNNEGGLNIQLVSIDGIEIPIPERRTVWNPVSFPAGKPLTLVVNIFYFATKTSGVDLYIIGFESITAGSWYNTDVTFNCPPLEAGKSYTLNAYGKGTNTRFILTDTKTKKKVYVYDQSVLKWKEGGKGNWEGETKNMQDKANDKRERHW